MFHPLPLYVGLRYVRSRAHKFFVSFITWVSLVGVALGVAALIVILSVMNGFEGELRSRLLSLSAPVRAFATDEAVAPDWSGLQHSLLGIAGVRSVTRYSELQTLAFHQPEMLPLQLRGIDTHAAAIVEPLREMLTEGSVDELGTDASAIVLGRLVATQLGVTVGDPVTLLVPVAGEGGLPAARLREFTVHGVFEAGIQDHDATLAFADLALVQALGAQSASSSGLRFEIDDALAAPDIATRIAATAGAGITVRDWTQDHANYFRAIRIEKTMMAIILMLIVTVAAFNIVAMLVMVVTDKRTDIAILRTFGASPARVMGIFITQGLVIGWLGVAAGVLGGVLLARNVDTVAAGLESVLGIQIMNADVYYITSIPSDLHWADVGIIAAFALLLTGLATLYPAWRASRIAPAEALRYE
ncbi:MAG: lipoprotein-releasing ABC transporter permease subunit [Steroidobacteraceae bacterium]